MLAGIVGMAAIVCGFLFAGKLFFAVKNTLQDPAGLHPVVAEWEEVIGGGEEVTAPVPNGEIPIGRIVAVAIVGVGTVVLVWIALGFVTTGARVVSWAVSDFDAMKKLTAELESRSKRRVPKDDERDAGDA
jgi:hypothetical protein